MDYFVTIGYNRAWYSVLTREYHSVREHVNWENHPKLIFISFFFLASPSPGIFFISILPPFLRPLPLSSLQCCPIKLHPISVLMSVEYWPIIEHRDGAASATQWHPFLKGFWDRPRCLMEFRFILKGSMSISNSLLPSQSEVQVKKKLQEHAHSSRLKVLGTVQLFLLATMETMGLILTSIHRCYCETAVTYCIHMWQYLLMPETISNSFSIFRHNKHAPYVFGWVLFNKSALGLLVVIIQISLFNRTHSEKTHGKSINVA